MTCGGNEADDERIIAMDEALARLHAWGTL